MKTQYFARILVGQKFQHRFWRYEKIKHFWCPIGDYNAFNLDTGDFCWFQESAKVLMFDK